MNIRMLDEHEAAKLTITGAVLEEIEGQRSFFRRVEAIIGEGGKRGCAILDRMDHENAALDYSVIEIRARNGSSLAREIVEIAEELDLGFTKRRDPTRPQISQAQGRIVIP